MFTLGFNVRLVGFLRRCVFAKPMRLSVDSDVGTPFVLKPNDTQKTRLIAFVRAVDVLRITVRANNAQIAKPVVIFAPVYVVNKPFGPCAMHMKPRQTMRFINAAAKAYGNVAKLIRRAGHVSNMHGFRRALTPRQSSCVSVVVQKLSDLFRCNFAFGHEALQLMSLNLNTETTK